MTATSPSSVWSHDCDTADSEAADGSQVADYTSGCDDNNTSTTVFKAGKSPDDIMRIDYAVDPANLSPGDTVTIYFGNAHNWTDCKLVPYDSATTVDGTNKLTYLISGGNPAVFTLTQAFIDDLYDQGSGSFAVRFTENTVAISGDLQISEVDADLTLGAAPLTVSVTDDVASIDATTRLGAILVTVTDDVVASIDATRLGAILVTITNNVVSTDVVTRFIGILRSVADNVEAADAVTRLGAILQSVADNVEAVDAVTRLGAILQSIVDNAASTDTVVRFIGILQSVADNVASIDVVTQRIGILQSIIDDVEATDAVARLGTILVTVIDDVETTDAVTRLIGILQSITDNVASADVVICLGAVFRTVEDNVITVDLADRVFEGGGELLVGTTGNVVVLDAVQQLGAILCGVGWEDAAASDVMPQRLGTILVGVGIEDAVVSDAVQSLVEGLADVEFSIEEDAVAADVVQTSAEFDRGELRIEMRMVLR